MGAGSSYPRVNSSLGAFTVLNMLLRRLFQHVRRHTNHVDEWIPYIPALFPRYVDAVLAFDLRNLLLITHIPLTNGTSLKVSHVYKLTIL